MAEPLSVALHAVRRAGPLLGQRVLVTGCGPIGALLVIAARRAGAAHVVVTDIGAYPLRKALQVGADEAINIAEESERLAHFTRTRASSTFCSRPAATSAPCAVPSTRCGRAGSSCRWDWAAT